jgi:hypothetical protein
VKIRDIVDTSLTYVLAGLWRRAAEYASASIAAAFTRGVLAARALVH